MESRFIQIQEVHGGGVGPDPAFPTRVVLCCTKLCGLGVKG